MIDKKQLINTDELNRYEQAVKAMMNGELDADRFQSIRLQQGIYGQRQQGVNMIRIKIPGGRLSPQQARMIAEVLTQFSSHETAHITTRQSVQIHYVPLAATPKAIRLLASAGLTTREACNNTVRNISACPLAGICPAEHTDISHPLKQATTHFLRHPLTQHLPRKFKISFSGCEQDCAQGMIHDLGVIAVNLDGKFGFRLLAGGGLGHKPHQAIVIDKFVAEQDLLASMEAILNVHNRYSDRRYRARSRLKFLVDRFGRDGLIEKYREELKRTSAAAILHPTASLTWHDQTRLINANPGAPHKPFTQKQTELTCLPINIPLGNISAAQLNGIADIMIKNGLAELRTSQDQNLMITGIPTASLPLISEQLTSLGLRSPVSGDNIVACPGTSTCRLGITSSQSMANVLGSSGIDLRLRVSGCHNGCAQPETGDIGIYGEGKRLFGRLIPHYQFFIGGNASKALGYKTYSIPSARVKTAITLLQNNYHHDRQPDETFFEWSQRKGSDYFDQLLKTLATVNKEDIETLIHDHGDPGEFQVIQFGGGECAGAAQETIAALFAEATNEANYRNAFLLQHKYSESLDAAKQVLRRVGQALLFIAAEPAIEDLDAIAQQLMQSMNTVNEVVTELEAFHQSLSQLETTFEIKIYRELISRMDKWAHMAATICQDFDKQLDLAQISPTENNAASNPESISIDLSSYGCPLHYIKARNTLRQHHAGAIINFTFGSEELAQKASKSLAADGHKLHDNDHSDPTRIQIQIAD